MRSSLMTPAGKGTVLGATLAATLAFTAPALAQSAAAPEPAAKPGATDTMERSAAPSESSGSGLSGSSVSGTVGDTGGSPQAAAIPPEDLKGMPVVDSAGEKIGEVESVRTGSGGDIERLIVSQGGFMGLGAKKVAIDGQQAQIQSDRVTLDLTGSQVSELPDYEEPTAPPAAN